MRFELFVAKRHLLTRRQQSFISIISLISVMGVALGVASLIVVIGVMTGFSNDLRDKMLGINAHALVMSLDGGFKDYGPALERAKAVPGVLAATPFIYSEVMLSSPQGFKGVVLRGVDPKTASSVLTVDRDMVEGGLEALSGRNGLPGIVIGQELAKRMRLGLGDRVNLLSPAGKPTAGGFTPKVQVLEIVGIFKTGMYEYDTSLAYVSLGAARNLLGYKNIQATGLELKVENVDRADEIATKVRDTLGPPVYVRNWIEMNQNLFAALKLEKTAMFIILAMIVLVGSFSIITTLVMLVMEKTRDIAVLMSMGATRESISRIFIYEGMLIGAVGTTIGYALGVTTALLLAKYHAVPGPQGLAPPARRGAAVRVGGLARHGIRAPGSAPSCLAFLTQPASLGAASVIRGDACGLRQRGFGDGWFARCCRTFPGL